MSLNAVLRAVTRDPLDPDDVRRALASAAISRAAVESAVARAPRDGELVIAADRELTAVEVRPELPEIIALQGDGCAFLYVIEGRIAFADLANERAEAPEVVIPAGEGEMLALAGSRVHLVLSARREGALVLVCRLGAGPLIRRPAPGHPAERTVRERAARNDYYYGYDSRYREVYRAGVELWETDAPNEALVHATQRFGSRGLGPRVLDLGCGEGRDSLFLAGAGLDVTGVDVSRAALDRARGLAAERGLACRFMERDVVYLRNIGDASFDFAINMGCMHMLTDPAHRAAHVARVRDVLRPGGHFLVAHCRSAWGRGFYSLPHYESLGKLVPGTVVDRRIRVPGEPRFLPLEVLPYSEVDDDALCAELVAGGFEIVEAMHRTTDAFGSTAVVLAQRPST